jgi:hypothetical protein
MANGANRGVELISVIVHAGERAVRDFNKLSGGEWFDESPEYFLTTYAASALKAIDKTYALLEVSVHGTLQEAGAIRRGRPAADERRNGRFDIVIYWANGSPRGAIEIKSPICSATKKLIRPDFTELCKTFVANSTSTFQFGAFLFYASVSKPERKYYSATQRLRKLIERVHEEAKLVSQENGVGCVLFPFSTRRGKDEDDGAWCIACVVFTRKGGEQSFK